MSAKAIILSVRPKYAEKIFSGVKTVELRRIRPKHLEIGHLAFVYASAPSKSLIGVFKVEKIIEKPLKELWKIVHQQAGVTFEEFQAYFKRMSVGVGIYFRDVRLFSTPIPLLELREELKEFLPPQSFRYVRAAELTTLGIAKFVKK